MSTINVTGDYVVGSSQSLTFTGGTPAYTLQGSSSANLTFTDQGSITVSSNQASTTAQAIANNTGGPFANELIVIAQGGSLTVNATGSTSNAYGYVSANITAAFENDGTFTVSATGVAVGETGYAPSQFSPHLGFDNTGVMQVTGASAYGVETNSASSYGNSGVIDVSGATIAVGLSLGDFDGGAGNGVTNSGTITATASAGASYGITVSGLAENLAIDNSGTITAQHAIYESSDLSPAQTPLLNLTNTGTINGDIVLGQGPESLGYASGTAGAGAQIKNSGAINGAIH